MDFFEVLELEELEIRQLSLKNENEIIKRISEYKSLDNEIEIIESYLEEADEKAHLIYMKMEKLDQKSKEYKKLKKKFDKFVTQYNQYEDQKRGVLTDMLELRKKIEGLI